MPLHSYTLADLMELGCEGWHLAEDGTFWLFHGCWALRVDTVSCTRTLVMDAALVPERPWRLTDWGRKELLRRDEAALA